VEVGGIKIGRERRGEERGLGLRGEPSPPPYHRLSKKQHGANARRTYTSSERAIAREIRGVGLGVDG